MDMENQNYIKNAIDSWCEALFSGFSGFGFGRVGRICHWAGLADQGGDDLVCQHVLKLQKSVRVVRSTLCKKNLLVHLRWENQVF